MRIEGEEADKITYLKLQQDLEWILWLYIHSRLL